MIIYLHYQCVVSGKTGGTHNVTKLLTTTSNLGMQPDIQGRNPYFLRILEIINPNMGFLFGNPVTCKVSKIPVCHIAPFTCMYTTTA